MERSKHIIFTLNGRVYSRMKDWSIERIEAVLNRLGSEYWEIGIDNRKGGYDGNSSK